MKTNSNGGWRNALPAVFYLVNNEKRVLTSSFFMFYALLNVEKCYLCG